MKKKIKYIIYTVLILIFAVFEIVHYKNSPYTKIISYGTIEDSFYVSADCIYDEDVSNSAIDGKIFRPFKDGERVSKGEVVAIIDSSDESKYENMLADINDKILIYKNKDIYKQDLPVIEKQINEYTKKLDGAGKNSKQADDYKNKIDELKNKKNTISNISSYSEDEYNNLLKQKNDIMKSINSSKVEMTSDKPGLIHYLSTGEAVKKNEKLFEIIDNYSWSISFRTDKQLPKAGNMVYVLFGSGNPVAFTVNDIKNSGGKNDVTLTTTYYVNDFYKIRNKKVKIILKDCEGLKVPNVAIVNKNGGKGVYVSGTTLKFYPIDIIATKGDYSIVKSKSDNDGLKIYDEVLCYKKADRGI